MFDECWRVMKYRFYDEKMHGRDWAAIQTRYEPLLRDVGENQDVYDLANEMIGELNASHTGVNGPPTRGCPRPTGTQLGFELEPGRPVATGSATSTVTGRPTRSGSTCGSATTCSPSTGRR